jgi:hypothetical protein
MSLIGAVAFLKITSKQDLNGSTLLASGPMRTLNVRSGIRNMLKYAVFILLRRLFAFKHHIFLS